MGISGRGCGGIGGLQVIVCETPDDMRALVFARINHLRRMEELAYDRASYSEMMTEKQRDRFMGFVCSCEQEISRLREAMK